ncbi:hypothetical protein SAMN04488071_2541 [Kordiimonas lacus]|uniref:Uncharacterized protein n=2 Tax=Kordiimonas lacus TaxID=637679 RepID=A0A1G7BKW0_9PROT|nr:hypothetical protein SAMN04488071_2541 [Kordiimonas lacus]
MRIFRATGKDFDAANANSFSEFYYSNCEGHLEFLADATALYNLYRAFPRVLAHLKIYREKEFYS